MQASGLMEPHAPQLYGAKSCFPNTLRMGRCGWWPLHAFSQLLSNLLAVGVGGGGSSHQIAVWGPSFTLGDQKPRWLRQFLLIDMAADTFVSQNKNVAGRGTPSRARNWLLSNTRKWIVQGDTCADKARDFIGKRTRVESRGWGNPGELLCRVAQSRVLWGWD